MFTSKAIRWCWLSRYATSVVRFEPSSGRVSCAGSCAPTSFWPCDAPHGVGCDAPPRLPRCLLPCPPATACGQRFWISRHPVSSWSNPGSRPTTRLYSPIRPTCPLTRWPNKRCAWWKMPGDDYCIQPTWVGQSVPWSAADVARKPGRLLPFECYRFSLGGFLR